MSLNLHFISVEFNLKVVSNSESEDYLFTRVEAFGGNAAIGNNDVSWTKVTVDPRSREVFSYQLEIVPANRTAVPAP